MDELNEFGEGANRIIVKSIRKGEIVQIYKVTMPLQKYSNWSDDDDEAQDDNECDKTFFSKYENRLCHTRILIKQKDQYFIHLHKSEQVLLKTSQYLFRVGPVLNDETETFLNKECSTRFGYDASYQHIQTPTTELKELRTANETIVELLSLKTRKDADKVANIGVNMFGETMLCVAAQQGSLACVKLFIKDIFDTNTFTLQTALMVAVINSHAHIVEYLLEYLKGNIGEEERHIFINTPCRQDKTALHYACKYGNEKMVTLLLENGADPNNVSCLGPTPLICTTSPNIIDILVAKGANINAVLYNKTTCLSKAVQKIDLVVVEKLLSYKETDVSFKNEENTTAEIKARRLQSHFKNFRESYYQLASKMVKLFEERTRRDIRDILLEVDKHICYDVISEITSYVV